MDFRRSAYTLQKQQARYRGIEFHFTFEGWCHWWEDNAGPNWLDKRGLRKGKLVMARNGDKGPYAPWNVTCITVEQNRKDAIRYQRLAEGKKLNFGLTDEQIRTIYLAEKSIPELSREFGVRYGFIRDIKLGARCQEITAGLGSAPRVWINHSKNNPVV